MIATVGAMGKNPEAAVAYFTAVPGDMERYDGWTPKPELNDRWAKLTERLEPGEKGYPGVTFTRLTAGLAGASALRQPPAPGEDTKVSYDAEWAGRKFVLVEASVFIDLIF